jgi:hypothetical protein
LFVSAPVVAAHNSPFMCSHVSQIIHSRIFLAW